MGCLPGNTIQLIQVAPMGDPLFFNINDAKVAIRKKTAQEIYILQESIQ
jgi:ferrous iron transport protein A